MHKGVYLQLFHGRDSKDEHMEDWGFPGPVFGPLKYVHTTYGSDIKFEYTDGSTGSNPSDGLLSAVDDMVYYDGRYYGDWSVFEMTDKLYRVHTVRIQAFSPAKASLKREDKSRMADDETAWLIEHGGLCLGFCENRFAWVTFTNENALRFSRKQDAYGFKETCKWTPFDLRLEDAIVAEHMFTKGGEYARQSA